MTGPGSTGYTGYLVLPVRGTGPVDYWLHWIHWLRVTGTTGPTGPTGYTGYTYTGYTGMTVHWTYWIQVTGLEWHWIHRSNNPLDTLVTGPTVLLDTPVPLVLLIHWLH